MKKLTNKGARRLGIPGRPALILNAGESASINDQQLKTIRKNKTVRRWLEAGVLIVEKTDDKKPVDKTIFVPKEESKRTTGMKRKDERKEVVLPDGVTGDGIERHHVGGGWWQVFVNGFLVTTRNVRKDESITIAAEYEK